MRRLAGWFPIFILTGVTALTWWIDQRMAGDEPQRVTAQRHDPDVVADGVEVVKLAPGGAPLYRLTADNVMHYPDTSTNQLENPLLIFYRKPAPLTARAKHATTDDKGTDVYLFDDVVLTRSASRGSSEMQMTTSWLHALPEQGIAKTDRPVVIRDANTYATSIGLEFDNNAHTVKLLSTVRGIYDKKGLPADARP